MRAIALALAFMLTPAALAQNGHDYRVETVAEGLVHPWSLAFLPDGAMLVTERLGRLRVIENGVLRAAPVSGVPAVFAAGQGGLLDVAADPDFADNDLIYLVYSHGDAAANTTALARARFNPAAHALQDLEVLFTAQSMRRTSAHYGGRIAFLADGTLLLALGDGFDHREQAQSRADHFGTVVRLNRDGSIPPDNPFADEGGAAAAIYTWGHRNPQGLAVDPETGTVYLNEHGPAGGDEINVLVSGGNYGWPLATRGMDYTGARVTPFSNYEGTIAPIVDWTPSIAPSGLAVYDGDLFPRWRGDLFSGALAGMHVRRTIMRDGAVAGEESLLEELGRRIRDVREGPDGALYILTDHADGQVLRLVPAE